MDILRNRRNINHIVITVRKPDTVLGPLVLFIINKFWRWQKYLSLIISNFIKLFLSVYLIIHSIFQVSIPPVQYPFLKNILRFPRLQRRILFRDSADYQRVIPRTEPRRIRCRTHQYMVNGLTILWISMVWMEIPKEVDLCQRPHHFQQVSTNQVFEILSVVAIVMLCGIVTFQNNYMNVKGALYTVFCWNVSIIDNGKSKRVTRLADSSEIKSVFRNIRLIVILP